MSSTVTHIRTFTREDTLIKNGDPRAEYRRRESETKRTERKGQRKLALSLLYFITTFWNPEEIPKPKIVYAGAAPSTGTSFVTDLPGLSTIEWHLYDPRDFEIKPRDNIKIYKEFFTDETARRWANRNDVFFISDIRTNTGQEYPTNADVTRDLKDQERWYGIINPVYAQLKFRLPYPDDSPDLVPYLHGYIFNQAWVGPTSTETRMVPYGDQKYTWSCLEYEQQLFYHNIIVREKVDYNNPFSGVPEPVSPSLPNNFDGTYETQIWIEYLGKFRGHALTTKENVVYYSDELTKRFGKRSVS